MALHEALVSITQDISWIWFKKGLSGYEENTVKDYSGHQCKICTYSGLRVWERDGFFVCFCLFFLFVGFFVWLVFLDFGAI